MKHKMWKRWTAALAAAAILFTPLATRAQTLDKPTTVVNHAIGATAEANEEESNNWGASKAIDGIVNRDEEDNTKQSRWSTNGKPTFEQVTTKNKILTINLGSVKSFDQLVLEWERDNITQFKIETAGANQEYTLFYEKTGDDVIESVTTTIDQAGQAQYLRLTVTGYTPGTINWASVSLYEFMVLETVPADNLALQDDVQATADSVEADTSFTADLAINGTVDRDGEHQSRWASAVDKAGTNPARWLALQFPSQQTVGTVIIEWERRNATQYALQYKATNEGEWVTAKSFTQAPDKYRDIIALETPIQATQLRVYITESDPAADMDPNKSWDNVSIYEFEVYAQTMEQGPAVPGNAKPVVVPELAEWTGGQGDFTITDDTRLVVNPDYMEDLTTAVTEFQKDYKDITGKTLTVADDTKPGQHDFYFTLGSNDTQLGEEGYLLKVTDSLTVEAVNAQGVYWATRSILQILAQTEDTIPQGTARDYPLYEVRGFMLDVGRKPISYEFLQTILKEMAWYKMNDFQIHLNDNSFQKEYPNATVDVAKQAYSGFRLESTIKAGGLDGLYKADLTSEDMYYTKDEMRSLIQDARALGIDIVPEIDTPAHSLALTKVRPDLIFAETLEGVDHLNLHTKYDDTISFVQSIFNEYMTGDDPVFDADTIIHVGTDEYDATYKEDFRKYTDDMLEFVQDTNRTVRLWGSLTMRPGNTEVRSDGVQMNVWNTGWADPNAMIQAGYDIINTDDSLLYIVPGVTRTAKPYYHDYLDAQSLYNTWNPTIFRNNTKVTSDKLLGATFAVWNDKSGSNSNGITEQDIYDRFADALPALASKMWGKGEDLNYQELVAAVDEIGVAPNNNPTYQASSVEGEYLSYTFEDGQEKADSTANDRDITKLHNVSTQYGTLELLGDDSYVETGLDKLGFGNALEFDVTLSEEAKPGQILFEADSEYYTHDIRILDDGTLGYTTELYDYSFGYKLPVGKTVHLRIESILEHSALIVNGVRHEAVGTYTEEATNLKLTNIGYPSFVLPLQRIGSETNSVVGFIDNVTVSVIAAAEQENHIASYEASSQASGNPIANAFDGKTSTFWHSAWGDAYTPLPVDVTINFDGVQAVTGFTYLPRQDNVPNGQVTKYDLEYKATADGDWIKIVTDGSWDANAQKKTATFDAVQAVALRFTAKEGTGDKNGTYACAAEFGVLYAEATDSQLSMEAYAQQGGTASVSSDTATVGQSVTFKAQAQEGYEFTGWYNLAGKLVSDQATYTVQVDSGLTLIAKFQEIAAQPTQYTVTFDTGDATTTVTVAEGQKVEKPQNPEKDGYTFEGWYTDQQHTQEYDFTAEVTGSFTLYAKWVKVEVDPDPDTDPDAKPTDPVDPDDQKPDTDPDTKPDTDPDTKPDTDADPDTSTPVTDGNVTVDNNSTVTVTMGNANEVFEPGTVITVESVTEGKVYDTVKEALKDVVADMKNTAVLDITAMKGEEKVQPDGKVQITFAIPEHLSADNLKLFYVSDDGKTTQEIAITVDKDARTVTANLEHFSTYVLANVVTNAADGTVPPTGDNSQMMVYVAALAASMTLLGAAAAVSRKRRG